MQTAERISGCELPLHPGHVQGPVCQEGPQNHQGPQPPQQQTLWGTAVGEAVPRPRGQNPEDEEPFFPQGVRLLGESLHYHHTNPTHDKTRHYLNLIFTALILSLHNICAVQCILHYDQPWLVPLPLDHFTFLLLILTYFINIYLLYIVLLLLCVCWGIKHNHFTPVYLCNKNVIKAILILILILTEKQRTESAKEYCGWG